MTERIELFYKKGSSKSKNDAENKIREEVLVFLENELPPEYASDEKWRNLHTQFHKTIKTLCPVEYSRVQIVKKAGRGFNYDFDVIYLDSTNAELHQAKLEFKHNSNKIEKTPQILSLQDRFGLIDALTYSEYYYINYLDKYLAAIEYDGEKPNLQEYISLVTGIAPEKHPMFVFMREAEKGPSKKITSAIVKESIHTYLQTYITKFNVDKFVKKLSESQKNKHFLLWDLSQFHIDTLSDDDIAIQHIQLKSKNTIIALSTTSEYNLLLRWRNHNGILNPAYQIKLTRKSGI